MSKYAIYFLVDSVIFPADPNNFINFTIMWFSCQAVLFPENAISVAAAFFDVIWIPRRLICFLAHLFQALRKVQKERAVSVILV